MCSSCTKVAVEYVSAHITHLTERREAATGGSSNGCGHCPHHKRLTGCFSHSTAQRRPPACCILGSSQQIKQPSATLTCKASSHTTAWNWKRCIYIYVHCSGNHKHWTHRIGRRDKGCVSALLLLSHLLISVSLFPYSAPRMKGRGRGKLEGRVVGQEEEEEDEDEATSSSES